MKIKFFTRAKRLKDWKKIQHQVEDEIVNLQKNKIELLGKSKEKDKAEAIKEKEKQYKEILKELKCLRGDNWVTDPNLSWQEKTFHYLVFVSGIILLKFALVLLWHVVDKDIQGVGSIASVVVLMILIIFSFLCISGRGLKTVEELEGRIKEAELIKLWGLIIKGFHKDG